MYELYTTKKINGIKIQASHGLMTWQKATDKGAKILAENLNVLVVLVLTEVESE